MDNDPWANEASSSRPQTPVHDVPIALDTANDDVSGEDIPEASSPTHGSTDQFRELGEDGADGTQSAHQTEEVAAEQIEANADHEEADLSGTKESTEDGNFVDQSGETQRGEAEGLEQTHGNDKSAHDEADEFDEFDDFDEAGPSTFTAGQAPIDDGFDDFDDFAEGTMAPPVEAAESEPEAPRWHALRVDPMPTTADLVAQLEDILRPVLVDEGDLLTDEPTRQVGGLSQIMVAESSREAYAQLTTPPVLKTLDWTRSRVRRDHLISMGVPVNLDEVDSHRLTSLPPLRISTNPNGTSHRLSVDSHSRSAVEKGKGKATSSGIQSVPVSALNGNASDRKSKEKYGLGPMPLFDTTKAEDLCGLDEDQLSLWSVERLRAIQEELVETTSAASALLAWRLQYKDAQVQDSETYNGMISELIANAAKAKSAQSASSGGVFKRASMRLPGGGSPGMSPRVGSPAMR